ncbi:MAG: DUF1540 domain-containing protein [Clostridia bacterium]|nr:DUF1540 domain-containing protein [Clostridia bacterium]
MYDLRCKREGCDFNKNCLCTAKHITIGRQAECTSYSPSENYLKTEKSTIKQKAVRTKTIADCKVSGCLFNQEGVCKANGITIATLDQKNEPECLTVKPK